MPQLLAYLSHGTNKMSTTVDQELLQKAREIYKANTDSALIDAALGALFFRPRSAQVDGEYKAYDEHPLEEPDEWGDLASFFEAAAKS